MPPALCVAIAALQIRVMLSETKALLAPKKTPLQLPGFIDNAGNFSGCGVSAESSSW